MTRHPNLDDYDKQIHEFDEEIIGYNELLDEIMCEYTEVDLDAISKDYINSEVLTAIKEMQS